MSRPVVMDAPVEKLGSRAARGSIILIAAQGGKSLCTFVSGMLLSRLLPPSAFGMSALVTSIVGSLALFSDFGLFTATVQRDELTDSQLSTVFWLNAGLAVLLALFGVALAPLVAWGFSDAQLFHVTLALCPVLLFSGLRHQPLALLSRRMQFGRLALAELVATLVGIAVAIFCALRGFGVYALIAQAVALSAVETLLIWLLARWLPGRPRLQSGLRDLLSFSGQLSAFQLLHYATRNVDNLLIGRFRNAHELGLYARAYGIMMLPHVAVTLPLQRVMVSTLARLQNDRAQFEKMFLRAVRSIAALSFPFGAGLYVLSEEAVQTVLGPRFDGTVPILRVLALGGMLHPLWHSMRWAFLGLGRTRQLLRFSLWTVPLVLGSFAVGVRWGALGVAVAYTIVAYGVVLPLGIWYMARALSLRITPYLRMLAAPLVASGLMAAAVYGLRAKLLLSAAPQLAVRVPILIGAGVLSYAIFLLLLSCSVYSETALLLSALRGSDPA